VCRGRQVRDGGAHGCAVPRAYANLNPGLAVIFSIIVFTPIPPSLRKHLILKSQDLGLRFS